MSCWICMEHSADGMACPTCNKKCCLLCESRLQGQSCPFCRGELLSFVEKFYRGTVQQRKFYISSYLQNEYDQILRNKKMDELFVQIIQNNVKSIDTTEFDDDELTYLIKLFVDYLYSLSNEQVPLSDIQLVLDFIELLWECVDPEFSGFKTIDEYIHQAVFDVGQQYQERMRKTHKRNPEIYVKHKKFNCHKRPTWSNGSKSFTRFNRMV